MDELRFVAHALSLPWSERKPGLIATIVAALEGDGLKRLLHELTPPALQALACELYGPPRAATTAYGQIPESGGAALYLFLNRRHPFPDELRERLCELVPPLRPADRDLYGDGPTLCTESAALEEVRILLRAAERGQLKVAPATGRLSSAGLKAMRSLLVIEDLFYLLDGTAPVDTIRPFAWPLLLEGSGLVERDGSTLRLTVAGRSALHLPAHEVIARIWRGYLAWKGFDELERVRAVQGQKKKRKSVLTSVVPRRAAVANALGQFQPGVWCPVERLSTILQRDDDMRVCNHPERLWVGTSVDSGSLYDATWFHLEGRYVQVLLMEFMGTLGMMDLRYHPPSEILNDLESLPYFGGAFLSVYDGLEEFRLTPLGAYCLQGADYRPQPQSRLKVVGTLVTPTAAPVPGARRYLDRFAERDGERWTLTAASLQRAVELQIFPGDVRSYLERESGSALPRASEEVLRGVERELSRCCDVGPARLIRIAPEELERVRAVRKLQGLFVEASGHLVVPEPHVEAVTRALARLDVRVAPCYFRSGADQPLPMHPELEADLLSGLLGGGR